MSFGASDLIPLVNGSLMKALTAAKACSAVNSVTTWID